MSTRRGKNKKSDTNVSTATPFSIKEMFNSMTKEVTALQQQSSKVNN